MTEGVELFKKAGYIKVTVQNRSKDKEHTKLLNKMSAGKRISPNDLKMYQSPTREYIEKETEFMFATIITAGNRERTEINMNQAKRWVRIYQSTLVQWEKRLQAWEGKPKQSMHTKLALAENCFWEIFIPGG